VSKKRKRSKASEINQINNLKRGRDCFVPRNDIMKNRIVRGIAGSFILISIVLSIYVNQNWLWFTVFVGANLLQSSITKWCLMDDILTKLGVKD
jgi:hypothetical protein